MRCPLIDIWKGPTFFPGYWCEEQCSTFGHLWSRMMFTFVLLVVYQSDKPITKYHIAWAANCCCYCHDCMFCFQPNELRWCLPL